IPPTTTTLAPGRLALSAGTVDFGSDATTRTVTLTNPGGQTVNWSTVQGPSGLRGGVSPFSMSPATGTLAGGATTTVTFTLDRSGAATTELVPHTISFIDGAAVASLKATGVFGPVISISQQPASPNCTTQYGLYFTIDVF